MSNVQKPCHSRLNVFIIFKKMNEGYHSYPETLEKCWSGENFCIQKMVNHSKVTTTDRSISVCTVIQLQKKRNGMSRCPIHVWTFSFFFNFQFNQRKKESYNRLLLLEKIKNKCKGKPAAHIFKRSEQLSKWGE